MSKEFVDAYRDARRAAADIHRRRARRDAPDLGQFPDFEQEFGRVIDHVITHRSSTPPAELRRDIADCATIQRYLWRQDEYRELRLYETAQAAGLTLSQMAKVWQVRGKTVIHNRICRLRSWLDGGSRAESAYRRIRHTVQATQQADAAAPLVLYSLAADLVASAAQLQWPDIPTDIAEDIAELREVLGQGDPRSTVPARLRILAGDLEALASRLPAEVVDLVQRIRTALPPRRPTSPVAAGEEKP